MAELPPPSMPTVGAIYAAYEDRRDEGWREHLGASIIGNECERSLWYTFRWATKLQHVGRLLRLFETGHLEEARLTRNLRDAGVTVLDLDPETGRQWSIRDETGHFGGSMDAVVVGLLEAPKTYHLAEFKTHNAKSFRELQKKGVADAKPVHHAQMQIYMEMAGLERGFYLAQCKDTDELYSERIKPDKAFALRLIAKAQRIIKAPVPPPRISEDPTYYLCRFCDHSAICHDGGWAPRNCRTCLHATPVEDGKWHCALQDRHLSRDEQRAGCLLHLYIPALVPGEQVDATDRTVTYRLRDGTEWVDGEEMA